MTLLFDALLACALIYVMGAPRSDPSLYVDKAPCEDWKCNYHASQCIVNKDNSVTCVCSVDKDGDSFSAESHCKIPTCDGKNGCSNRGICMHKSTADHRHSQSATQICVCDTGYTGVDCSISLIPTQSTTLETTATITTSGATASTSGATASSGSTTLTTTTLPITTLTTTLTTTTATTASTSTATATTTLPTTTVTTTMVTTTLTTTTATTTTVATTTVTTTLSTTTAATTTMSTTSTTTMPSTSMTTTTATTAQTTTSTTTIATATSTTTGTTTAATTTFTTISTTTTARASNITTIAGNGTAGKIGDNGPATSAELNQPTQIAFDADGNVYIADSNNNRIRKITVSTGIITTFAGTGVLFGYSGDNGSATSAQLYGPNGLALDSAGNLYIADSGNNFIRKVIISTGIITTVVGTGATSGGTGISGYSGDNGPATSALMNGPRGIALDSAGNLYIADTFNNCIRKFTVSTGIITTIAGNGTAGHSGDNGLAKSALLHSPKGIAFDSVGNLYIADTFNNCIRKITFATDTITTIAGNGMAGYSGDNSSATSAKLNGPQSVTLDSTGNIYIGDTGNQRIRKVTGSTDIITTIAGTGMAGYSGDNGPATAAKLTTPIGVTVDTTGNVYIADSFNNRIRKVNV